MIVFLLLVIIVLLYEISSNIKALNNNIIEIMIFIEKYRKENKL